MGSGAGLRGNVLVVMSGVKWRRGWRGSVEAQQAVTRKGPEGVERKGKEKSPFLMPVETWNGKGGI